MGICEGSKNDIKVESKSALKSEIKQELKTELKNELNTGPQNEKGTETYTGHKPVPLKILIKLSKLSVRL